MQSLNETKQVISYLGAHGNKRGEKKSSVPIFIFSAEMQSKQSFRTNFAETT